MVFESRLPLINLLDGPCPNLETAQRLAQFDPDLGFKVLACWRPPFKQPCRRPRFCSSCAGYRQRQQFQAHRAHLEMMRRPILLTLTTPGLPHISKAHLVSFRKRLSSLRRWKGFADAVLGGFYSIETKFGASALWSVHVHLLLDLGSNSLDETALREAWHRRTGGYKLDLQPVTPGTAPAVFLYLTKAPELPEGKLQLQQFVCATFGFRNFQPFGTCRSRRRMSENESK